MRYVLHYVETDSLKLEENGNRRLHACSFFVYTVLCGQAKKLLHKAGRFGLRNRKRGIKMNKSYQVSEAADELEIEVYTLRYWETQLGIGVPRNRAGHRYYEEEQLALFRSVKRLKEAGFTLRQIKAMEERMSAVAALPEEKLEELRRRIVGMESEQEEALAQRVSREPGMETAPEETESFGKELVPLRTDTETVFAGMLQTDGGRLLQEGMTRWLDEMIQKNNEQLSQRIEEGVSERMARELRFLFRQQEEREEERYRRLDRTIREYQQARANGKQQTSSLESFLLTRKMRPLR